MKKLSFMALQLAVAALVFIGCGDHAETFIKWDNDNGGTLEVTNTSNKDIVVFYGAVPTKSSIMGGVRATSTKAFDISKYVSGNDYGAGGYIVLKGITREEYNNNELDLSKAKVEFNAFATYKAGEIYRVTIDRNYMGDYAVRIINRGEYGLELRRDSPDGEKVAYMPALKQNQMLYTQTSEALTLFPVYVVYNKRTQEIITLKATNIFESVTVRGDRVSDPSKISTVYFPNDPNFSWEKIVGSLKSPVAYIAVTSGVYNQAAYFTNAGSKRYYSQEGYDAINGGETLIFEVEAGDYDEDNKTGGKQLDLVFMLYGGQVEVPVFFEGDDTKSAPRIKNGYNYNVSLRGTNANGYTATIEEVNKRSFASDIESP
ncbi:MAG: hypothetical protein LBB36_00160 [Fibromonadaceae bacterium]|nr:hypothetical protein [Fibromonadaceae bacterium]